jgi:hypothetical protein
LETPATINHFQRTLRASALLAGSVLLTSLTWILAGIPLRGLRLLVGSVGYWLMVAGTSVAAAYFGGWLLLACFLSMAATIGIFADLEERGHSLMASGFSAVITTVLIGGGCAAYALVKSGVSWQDTVQAKIESYTASAPALLEAYHIETKDLVAQMPSVAVAVLILGLFVALVSQPRLKVLGAAPKVPVHRLTRFAVPDFFVWMVIASIAGSYVKFGPTWVNPTFVNLMNVCAVVLFLQGLAVVISFFGFFRLGWLWQALILMALISQLFMLVSLLGLMDYWFDFRARLAKRSTQIDRERNV